jgi:Ni/Co efflux regulator RcnB
MKRIAPIVAAGLLAYSPASFAKPPPENGKGNNASQAKGSAKGKVGPAAVRNAGRDDRSGRGDRASATRQADAQWIYRGRTYDQFDVPAYRLPPGQAKKIFNTGERLPASYYAQNPTYVLSNPVQYQLSPAPAGYRWVRVDNDVYLVRSETGLITEVIRRIFR